MAALFATSGCLSALIGWRCWLASAELRQPERTLVSSTVGLMAGSGAAFVLFLVASIIAA